MTRRVHIGTIVGAALLAAANAHAGPEWVEQNHGSGDTGSLPNSGLQSVSASAGGSVTTIKGKVAGVSGFGPTGDFEDMYIIRIDDPENFMASTSSFFGGSADFDTQLWLFGISGDPKQGPIDGFGLLGNDDTVILTIGGGFSTGSTLTNMSTDGTETVITEPGLYLLAVTTTASSPQSNGGFIFSFTGAGEISGPDGPGGGSPISSWYFSPPKDALGLGGDYEIVLAGVGSVQSTRQLFLDLKPGGCPNSFNRTSNGVLPSAILGTADFDVHDINVSTVVISRVDGLGGSVSPNEGPPGPHSTYDDVGTPFSGDECECHGAGADGFTDLSMKFKSTTLVSTLLLNDLPAGALVPLKVSGELNDGTPFESFDCLRLVPPGAPPGLISVNASVAGTWINISPLDLQLDGGGFASFQRTYPQSTLATFTAPANSAGWGFQGWRINGSTTLIQGTTLTYPVTNTTTSVEAVYWPPHRP